MSVKFFLDTNVLVYANDSASPAKQERARAFIERALATRGGCLSTQVLQEFFVAGTKKLGISAANLREQIIELRKLETVVIDEDLITGAIDLHLLHRISFWDALIVKAAAVSGCQQLITEDLNHGQVIEGVRVENPFVN